MLPLTLPLERECTIVFIITALKILFMLTYADTEQVYKGTQHQCQDVWTAAIYNL